MDYLTGKLTSLNHSFLEERDRLGRAIGQDNMQDMASSLRRERFESAMQPTLSPLQLAQIQDCIRSIEPLPRKKSNEANTDLVMILMKSQEELRKIGDPRQKLMDQTILFECYIGHMDTEKPSYGRACQILTRFSDGEIDYDEANSTIRKLYEENQK